MGFRSPLILVVSVLIPVAAADLRLGLIGLDTSHVIAYAELLNDTGNPNHIRGARIVAAYKGGSPDMNLSASRLEGFTAELKNRFQVQIVDDIPTLCRMVDGILLTSVDGRVHAAQAWCFRSISPSLLTNHWLSRSPMHCRSRRWARRPARPGSALL